MMHHFGDEGRLPRCGGYAWAVCVARDRLTDLTGSHAMLLPAVSHVGRDWV